MQARQQDVSLVESDPSPVSVVSSVLPIEMCLCLDLSVAKLNMAAFALAISSSSIPVINERDCDNTSHLKIGLLNVRSLTSKTVIVNELITDHNLDVIGLTETWLKA